MVQHTIAYAYHTTTGRVPTYPGILEKFLNFILKVQGLEIYLNFVKNPGIFNKILEKVLSFEHGIILVEFCLQIA